MLAATPPARNERCRTVIPVSVREIRPIPDVTIASAGEHEQQVFSLVIAAPEPIRVRFRGKKLAAMLNAAANLRVHSSWDVGTTSTVVALRTLARRAHAMLKEARELRKAIVAVIRT